MDQVASHPTNPSLLGRDLPLAMLAAAIADARAGTRGVVLVEGEAGVGKTTLLRAALRDDPVVVVWAGGDEAEVDVDHGVIEQLARAAPIAADQRRDLLLALGGDPLRTGAALVGLVDSLDIDPARPLVVVVDDAHWADLPSLRALTFAARRLRRDPVVLCVAMRSEAVSHLPEGLVRLADDEGTRIRLKPLELADVRKLAEARGGPPVSMAAADRLLAHTRGNPLHVKTLLDELPPGALAASGELPSPRSFSMLVLSRLAGCAPAVEALVTAVAVLGEPVPLRTAAALAELDDPLPTFDAAVAHGLLVPVPESGVEDAGMAVATPHPLVRAAVLGDLPTGRRAELHRRAAAIVGGAPGLRHHLLGAHGPEGELWHEAMAAASEETSRGAHGASAALLRDAARVAPSREDRDRTLLDAVDQFLLAGRLEDATALRPSIEAANRSPRRSYVRGRLAYVAGPRRAAREHLSEGWAALVEAAGGEGGLGALPSPDRELAGRLAAMQATTSVDRAAGEEAIRWCHWALALAPTQAALASTAHMLAGAHALAGRIPEGLHALDAICKDLAGAVELGGPAVADAYCGRGLLKLWSHDLPGAAVDLDVSLAAAATAGSFAARESARFYLAETRYRQGRWDDAVLLAQTAASIVDDAEQAWMAALPHATAARPLAARGDATARGHLDQAGAAAAAIGSGVGIGLSQISALEVAACERAHERVVEIGAGLWSNARGRVDERIAPWRASYAEALVALGRTAEAEDVLADLRAADATPLVLNDVARVAVAVSAATGEHTSVDSGAEAGLALDADAVGPYPRGRLELAAGRAWRRRGDRRRAQAVLELALARFRGLGAEPWVEQVEREITASGLRPARRTVRARSALTPQEQAVAQLVARGLTNREVGAELVVSAKTVEHHLSRVYAKLGIRSRTELARAIDEPGH